MSNDTQALSLTDFLLARIAEDERVTREAAEWAVGPWYVERGESGVFASARVPVVFDPRGYTGNARTHLDHIARHDPARVLAECEAKRRIVERLAQAERLFQANSEKHAEASRGGLDNQGQITALRTHGWELGGRRDALRYVVDVMAAVYADHPDYRDEWA
jgi:hypothetical protein